ncbi:MAG: PAS domain-containing protein, partial [Desulforhopalus sp.]
MKEAERELRQELEDRLRFETLLTEISALLINLPSDQIGSWIEEAQRRICEFLHFDLSALWQWSAEAPEVLTLTHLYTVPGGPSRPEQLNAYEAFPWVTQQISDGDLLTISTEHLGPEAAVDQQSLRYYGVKSSIVIPLSVGGKKPIGVVSFDTLHNERNSPPEIVKRLTLVAQIFSNALSRMESDRMLRQSEARLSLAADSAGAGLWELDFDSNLFWATERAKKIFGYNPKEIISLERFEKSVHPDDLDAVRQVITLAFERLEPFKIEYRVLVGDRSMKWIYSCGRPSVDAAGQPTGLLGASIDIS